MTQGDDTGRKRARNSAGREGSSMRRRCRKAKTEAGEATAARATGPQDQAGRIASAGRSGTSRKWGEWAPGSRGTVTPPGRRQPTRRRTARDRIPAEHPELASPWIAERDHERVESVAARTAGARGAPSAMRAVPFRRSKSQPVRCRWRVTRREGSLASIGRSRRAVLSCIRFSPR